MPRRIRGGETPYSNHCLLLTGRRHSQEFDCLVSWRRQSRYAPTPDYLCAVRKSLRCVRRSAVVSVAQFEPTELARQSHNALTTLEPVGVANMEACRHLLSLNWGKLEWIQPTISGTGSSQPLSLFLILAVLRIPRGSILHLFLQLDRTTFHSQLGRQWLSCGSSAHDTMRPRCS